MKILLEIPDNKALSFMDIMNSISYVKVRPISKVKARLLSDIKDAIEEMNLIKDMGANFIRLGHYQQSRITLNLCDSLGILAWEEIPWCRGGVGGDRYKNQAYGMMTNMITQHRNHPAIILWGLGNENDWPGDFPTYDKKEVRNFMITLNELAHKLDPSRKT